MEHNENGLRQALINLEKNEALSIIDGLLKKGEPPMGIIEVLTQELEDVGSRFSKGDLFIPELVLSGEIAKTVMDKLRPYLSLTEGESLKTRGKIVIGTVEGDLHDLGKNLVGIMISSAGYEVVDLGMDVPTQKFVETVATERPAVLGLSALLTTTMKKQREVIQALEKENLRERVKVIIGGAPTTKEWADEIKADEYGSDAIHAVRVVKLLTKGGSVE